MFPARLLGLLVSPFLLMLGPLVGVAVSGRVFADAGSASARVVAQKTKEKPKQQEKTKLPPSKKQEYKTAPGITPEREAAVMKFVEQHHPELSKLLVQLKESNSAEYERAVRDLFRVSEQLAETHDRDLQRYELELKRWQAQSRVDLLVARLQMSGGDELRGQLRQTLDELYTIKQSLLRLERERLAERIKKLDAQLEAGEGKRQDVIERELRVMSTKADNEKRRGGTNKKKVAAP